MEKQKTYPDLNPLFIKLWKKGGIGLGNDINNYTPVRGGRKI